MKKITLLTASIFAAIAAAAAADNAELFRGNWNTHKAAKITKSEKGTLLGRAQDTGAWIITQRFKAEAGASYVLEAEIQNVPPKTSMTIILRWDKERKVLVFKDKANGVYKLKETFTVSGQGKNANVGIWSMMPKGCKENMLLTRFSLKKAGK